MPPLASTTMVTSVRCVCSARAAVEGNACQNDAQEDKPRSAIAAECVRLLRLDGDWLPTSHRYLAHGYVLGDAAIAKSALACPRCSVVYRLSNSHRHRA